MGGDKVSEKRRRAIQGDVCVLLNESIRGVSDVTQNEIGQVLSREEEVHECF